MRRGQVSLEFLVVSFFVISLLGFWLMQVNDFSTKMTAKACEENSEASLSLLADAVDSVYFMGEGNSQELVLFFPSETNLSHGNRKVKGSSKCFSSSREILPEVKLEKKVFHGEEKVFLKRKGSKVLLESK